MRRRPHWSCSCCGALRGAGDIIDAMAVHASTICSVPGCGELEPCPEHDREVAPKATRASIICPRCHRLQPCPVHRSSWRDSSGRAYNEGRLSDDPTYRRNRPLVLARDVRCTECGINASTQAHHLGTPDDHRLEMLAGVCVPCHNKLTAAKATAVRRAKRKEREERRRLGLD
jgi:hypothetical protein